VTAARRVWAARYRAVRVAGLPSVYRHPPLIRAEAARLRAAGALADVDRAERLALASVADWHSRNAARALGGFNDPAHVAEALNHAAEARRRGAKATARLCVLAARDYRHKESRR
jgi:hypothetical protein